MAAQNITLGYGDVFVAGGVESMSRVPMMGFSPSLNPRLMKHKEGEDYTSPYPPAEQEYALSSYIPMGVTAENLARTYQISRQAQDAFALRSHQRAIAAIDSGFFTREIVPVLLPDGRLMDTDEGPRRDTSLEKLATPARSMMPLPRRRANWEFSPLQESSRWLWPACDQISWASARCQL